MCLVTPPHPSLHRSILRWVGIILRAFDFTRVPGTSIVGLSLLTWVEKICKDLVKNLMRALGSTPGSPPICPLLVLARTADRRRRADMPAYLWDAKAFPFFAVFFQGMRKLFPSSNMRQFLSVSFFFGP